MNSVEEILEAFSKFKQTGRISLSREAFGYLRHVIEKCNARGSHPLLALLTFEAADGTQVLDFLTACASSDPREAA